MYRMMATDYCFHVVTWESLVKVPVDDFEIECLSPESSGGVTPDCTSMPDKLKRI